MTSIKDHIYAKAPNFIQEAMVTVYNFLAYKKRYGPLYHSFLKELQANERLSLSELKEIQKKNYSAFLNYTHEHSSYFQETLGSIPDFEKIENIARLPITSKETLRRNNATIHTIAKSQGVVSKTGGTTGKSLEVYFDKSDLQMRHAYLDHFRSKYGYELGKKTAWFSGKSLLSDHDIRKNRFWKTDYLNKIKFYSTFHIQDKFLKHYLDDLIKFRPAYMVGFPSTMCEVARYGLSNNVSYPENSITAIFPTAETITPEIRATLEGFFKTKVYDQYASSEGAPFITECPERKLHLELQSGVFEVLDENDKPSQKGRLIVTAFNTRGTPLIRYDIGDNIELDDKNDPCPCGNANPRVLRILGRISDYIYSQETGQINLGNVSNCMKDVKGILKFQVIQDKIDDITILAVKDSKTYTPHYEKTFLKNFRDRVGANMKINLEYVEDIPVEASGKFRMIKNSIKDQVENNTA